MNKFLGILVLGLLWCNVGNAQPVVLECMDDDPYPNTIRLEYYSLDIEKKNFMFLGSKVTAKECSLGNCEEITKANRKLAFIYDEPNYLSIGIKDQDQHTFNKKDLSLTWASFYWSEIGSTNTFKQVNTIYYYSCRKTKKTPF